MIFTSDNISAESFALSENVTAKAPSCMHKPLLQELWYGHTYHSCKLTFENCNQLIFSVGEVVVPDTEGHFYALRVTPKGLCIAAESEKGLLAGFMTLLDRITPELTIPCCDLKESPVIRNRMAHFCVFPETEIWEIQKFIRLCGVLKFSHVVLEFWGMLKYDVLKELSWSHGFTKKQILPLIREANDMGMEIIPMFNHWGHASAGRVMHGKHVVLDQNPRLQYLFNEDGWTWDINKKEVRDLLKQIRLELMDLCGTGGYFHLGCDEAYNFEINKENSDHIMDFLHDITEDLSLYGRRPIMWGDMLVTQHSDYNPANNYSVNCPNEEMEAYLLEHLDKRIIIADWQYWVKQAPIETALVFKKAGFDVMLCPWDRSADAMTSCCATAVDEDLFGIMHTTWHTLSAGMPYVTRCAIHSWKKDAASAAGADIAAKTAAVLRKAHYADGDYEKAGWARYQVDVIH